MKEFRGWAVFNDGDGCLWHNTIRATRSEVIKFCMGLYSGDLIPSWNRFRSHFGVSLRKVIVREDE